MNPRGEEENENFPLSFKYGAYAAHMHYQWWLAEGLAIADPTNVTTRPDPLGQPSSAHKEALRRISRLSLEEE